MVAGGKKMTREKTDTDRKTDIYRQTGDNKSNQTGQERTGTVEQEHEQV